MIPKVIYQTWLTKDLPIEVISYIEEFMKMNPEYRREFYDDADVERYIQENYEERIYQAYKHLNIGAAKADFWRYLILYKKGGIYLDIDSAIIARLDDFIKEEDKAIISREGNLGVFLQWGLMFEAGHPILKATIEECVRNIESRIYTHIPEVVGPKAFTRAIQNTLCPYLGEQLRQQLYFMEDHDLNQRIIQSVPSDTQCRFYNVDYKDYCVWKHINSKSLYEQQLPWYTFSQKDTFC
jgi:mannosyltransferase OCH1-like enzyme